MQIIRKEQMGAFSELVQKNFEDRMVVHVQECFPKRYEELGEPKVRQAVRHGIEQAGLYNLHGERDVAQYIDLMVALGLDFDTSPKTPWAAPILRSSVLTAEQKLDRLYDRAYQ